MSLKTSFKLPCGSKSSYPEKIDYLTRKGGVCVFHATSDKTYDGFLIVPKKKGIDIISEGTTIEVAVRYEALDLAEYEVNDANGVFFYKYAESQDAFRAALEKVSNLQEQ